MSDVFNPAGLVGDIFNGIGQLATLEQNERWRSKEFESNEYWRNVAQQNYIQQMNFQKQVYENTLAREDNAIQRRVKDMQAAGLNPVNALGANSSASMSTVAQPHFNPSSSTPLMFKQINFDNAIALAQLKMQQKLNDANVNKIDSETNLNNARITDVVASEEERRANIDFLKSKTNLTDKQVEETSERMNLIRSQIDVNQATAYKITQETNNIIQNNRVIRQQYEKLVAETNKINNDLRIDNIKAFETEFKNQVLLMYPEKYRAAISAEWDKSVSELKLLNTTNGTRISTEIRNWCDSVVSDAIKIRFAFF